MPDYQLFAPFVGHWLGTGRGEYSTIESFEYTEDLFIVATPIAGVLQYDQRTRRAGPDGKVIPSHMELGFIRMMDDERIQFANTQASGRVEVLSGTIGLDSEAVVLTVQHTLIGNDDRVKATSRTFRVDGDVLTYQQDMAMVSMPDIQFHTTAMLRRLPTFLTI